MSIILFLQCCHSKNGSRLLKLINYAAAKVTSEEAGPFCSGSLIV